MSRKLFYMVRHGESLLNASHVRQGSEGGLSPEGIIQAGATGIRLAPTKFDVMFYSPYERTKETAEIIANYIKLAKPPEPLDLLIERRNPTEIIGKSANDPEVAHIVDLIDKSYHADDYHYSDEENFIDLKNRARKLLDYLAHRPEKLVLSVTHSIFLKMISAYILHGDSLTAKNYNLLSYTNDSNNAGITVYEYNAGFLGDGRLGQFFFPSEKRWNILIWDDHVGPPKKSPRPESDDIWQE